MADHTHETVRRLFDQLLDVPAEQREPVLDRECAGDVGLKRRILAMVAAAEDDGFLGDATSDLDLGVTPESTFAAHREAIGQQISRYKLLEVIGEGGFGTVWAAEQRVPVRRRVALKIIKLGMDTKQVIARFEAERQALAMMDHPNIAKVLDAGATDTGRPFFVMELVKGVPILEYCDNETLDTKARLGLFTQVCNAIQHAHQKGIIHRDIKPSNVLVTLHDGVPVPKVIDFGIAKATNFELTEKTIYTQHRQMIGTPAYVSPEQAEMSGLDIDTRSDIYSLGVLLYELLTGTTPFTKEELASAGVEGMMRMIREVEPHKPSTRLSTLGATATRSAEQRRADVHKLGSLLRGDLDWIVMKCLEKDRTRRYETANGLVADIRRHLDDEPVLAGPPSAAYRLAKFVRRNRTGVAAACAVMLAITLGLGGMTWMFFQAESARRHATEQYRQAERARADAAALNDYFMRVFGEIGWTSSGTDGYPPAQEMSAGEFLMRAIDLVDEGLDGHPLLEAEVRLALNAALFPFDEYELFSDDDSSILALYERAGLREDDPDVLTVKISDALAVSSIVVTDMSGAERAKELWGMLRAVAGPCDIRTRQTAFSTAFALLIVDRPEDALELIESVGDDGCDVPESAADRTRIALLRVLHCWVLAHVGRHDEAEARVVELLGESSYMMPDFARGWALMGLASMRSRIGREGDHYELLKEGLDLYRRTLGPSHSFTLSWESDIATVLIYEGRPDEAEQAARATFDRIATVSTGSSAMAPMKAALDLIGVLLIVGEAEEAAQILSGVVPDRRAEGVLAQLPLAVQHFDVALTRIAGDAERVLAIAPRARATFENAGLPFDGAIIGALLQREIAYANAVLGRFDEARAGFERAREMSIEAFGPDTPWRRWIELDLAKLDAGELDPSVYLQEGWAELAAARR